MNLVRQGGWANIWNAVLAVGWPDEKCVIVWPGPEVLLSRLSENGGLYLLRSTRQVLGIQVADSSSKRRACSSR